MQDKYKVQDKYKALQASQCHISFLVSGLAIWGSLCLCTLTISNTIKRLSRAWCPTPRLREEAARLAEIAEEEKHRAADVKRRRKEDEAKLQAAAIAKAEADKRSAEAAAAKQAQEEEDAAKVEAANLAATAAATKAGSTAPLPTSASGAPVLGGLHVLVSSQCQRLTWCWCKNFGALWCRHLRPVMPYSCNLQATCLESECVLYQCACQCRRKT